jgi:hypothetical protein
MARLDMKTYNLINDLNGNFGAYGNNHARACLIELEQVFADIKKTVSELDGVWNDEAQKIFMDKLNRKTEQIQFYIKEMSGFFDELGDAVFKISYWDSSLTRKLSDPQLKG